METGRPTKYTDELADEICRRMSNGESVNKIAQDPDMPARSTIMLWAAQDRCGFSDKYAKAGEARAMYWAEEIVEIADDESGDLIPASDGMDKPNSAKVNRDRLRVDTRKWLLSKLLLRYSDSNKDGSAGGDEAATPQKIQIEVVDARKKNP